VTVGARVEKNKTFASIIEQHFGYEVHNLGIGATGAEYSATCIQSMVESEIEEKDIIFDIITVEFSINGLGQLDVLLKRLRLRYPDALIIYVDLYAYLENNPKFKCMKAGFETGKNVDCKYGNLSSVDLVGGIIYELPSPFHKSIHGSRNWFASDNVHLSSAGHFNVAAGIVSIFESEWQNIPNEPRLGNWYGGDHCFSFFRGKIPSQVHILKGELASFNQIGHKYAIEAQKDEKIEIAFHLDGYTQITLAHMITGVPSLYPKVEVILNQTERPLVKIKHRLQPMAINFHHIQRWYKFDDIIGPGKTILSITELEGTDLPFRLTGIMGCSVCAVVDDLFSSL